MKKISSIPELNWLVTLCAAFLLLLNLLVFGINEYNQKRHQEYVELRAYTRENSPFVVITLVNSCKEDPFSRPGKTLASTKPNPHRHGLGLKSVRRVIDRYQGDMKMYYDLPTLSFHTIVTLRMEKK